MMNSCLNVIEYNCKQLGHSLGNPLMLFPYRNTNPHFFQRAFFQFSIQELGWTLLYWQLCDHKLFFKFEYLLLTLSSYIVAARQRENMKYLSGHRELKAPFLHGNVSGIRDNSLQWWAKQPFCGNVFFVMFSGAQLHKYAFLLTCSECGEYGLFDGALLHQTDLKCSF